VTKESMELQERAKVMTKE